MRNEGLQEANAGDVHPGADKFQQTVFSSLNKLLTHKKRDWASKVLSWSAPEASRSQDPGGSNTQLTQEPNFATFTRRTSAL